MQGSPKQTEHICEHPFTEHICEHPFVKQIDHVGIQIADPARLFAFCTEVLDLPVAFPFAEYPAYTTGSVVLGNIFLEITRFGAAPKAAENREPAAHYHILGFLMKPDRLSYALADLKRRGIPHSGAVPFFAPEATDENPHKLWTNVFLGGFLGDGFWRRLFMLMTRSSSPKPSMQHSKVGLALSTFLLKRAFPNGFPVLTEYHTQNDDEKRAVDWEALRARNGGALGVERMQEVVVGTPGSDPAASELARLLAPVEPRDDGSWHLGVGPALRIVPQSAPLIQTIVLKVASLARARQFITDAALSTQEIGERVELVLPGTGGLTVQLTE